ncbi:MAG: T9SS type A sorting domain-containing protein [Calditrichia bacterium]
MKIFSTILFLFFLIAAPAAFGQVTINSGEFPTGFGTEMIFYNADDTTGAGLPVSVGTSGGPQNWSFSPSSYPGGYTDTTIIVDPATTIFAGDFPNADFAYQYSDTSGTAYNYLSISSAELLDLGFGVNSSLGNFVSPKNPPEKVLEFPLSMGKNWMTMTSDTTDFGIPGVFYVSKTERNNLVDAYGTITTPLGVYSALRLRTDVNYYNETHAAGTVFVDSSSNIDYIWLAENIGVVANVSSLDGETNPDFSMASYVSFLGSGTSAIDETEPPVASGYSLSQNFPNPFNPETSIKFSLPVSENVQITIFNIAGQKVGTLFNGRLTAGSHTVTFNGENYPSGIYFYKLETAGWSDVKRMILMK